MNTRLQHSTANAIIHLMTNKTYYHNTRTPIDINDLIFSYLDTKKCDDCDYINNHSKWLTNPLPFDAELYCPDCNKTCIICNSVYVNEDMEKIDCNNYESDAFACKCCLRNSDQYFYCECCVLHYCKCYQCNHEYRCDDCGTAYCENCLDTGEILECSECNLLSCCNRFLLIGTNLIGECCLTNYSYPHRCSKNSYN